MIAVIIVSWNHLESTTAPCLRSVATYTEMPCRVICVDNASRDGTPEFLKSFSMEDPRFHPVLLGENLGWARGVIEGLKHLKEEDEYVCLLNSDTVVTPQWLTKMTACLRVHPGKTGVIPNEYPDLEETHEGRPTNILTSVAGWVRRLFSKGGARPADSPPPIEDILKVAAEVERRWKGMSEPAAPSGFCLLTAKENLTSMREYLGDFDRYHSGELDWREFAREVGGECYRALDTYIFHARGGSGGYYRYTRKRTI